MLQNSDWVNIPSQPPLPVAFAFIPDQIVLEHGYTMAIISGEISGGVMNASQWAGRCCLYQSLSLLSLLSSPQSCFFTPGGSSELHVKETAAACECERENGFREEIQIKSQSWTVHPDRGAQILSEDFKLYHLSEPRFEPKESRTRNRHKPPGAM